MGSVGDLGLPAGSGASGGSWLPYDYTRLLYSLGRDHLTLNPKPEALKLKPLEP